MSVPIDACTGGCVTTIAGMRVQVIVVTTEVVAEVVVCVNIAPLIIDGVDGIPVG